MSTASDGTTKSAPQALTRREMREQERLASAAILTADATKLVAAELSEPDLQQVVVAPDDRVIAAEGSRDAQPADFQHLLSPEPTVTTSIPLVGAAAGASRASRRSERAGATARLSEAEAPFAPTRRFVPTVTPRASVASSRVKPLSRVRRLATTGMTVAAMSFVALMAVSTSLPAEALLSSSDVQEAALASQRPAEVEPAQTLDLAGGDTITVERDGYASSTIAAEAAASGIRMEATFTNNPNGTIQWPFAVGVHIGDQFGYRNCAGCSVNHGGQDFNPGLGAPIQAISDGVVSFAEDGENSLGVHMIIDHMIDGKLVSSVYAHMIHGSMLFKVGDVVKVGQVIGKTGSTGMSTGPHLHFEIREGGITGTKVDSLQWLYANTN